MPEISLADVAMCAGVYRTLIPVSRVCVRCGIGCVCGPAAHVLASNKECLFTNNLSHITMNHENEHDLPSKEDHLPSPCAK